MTEYLFAEKPVIEGLKAQGYEFVPASEHANLRESDNHVLFKPHVIDALKRLNGLSDDDARAVYQDLLNETSNEEWTYKLRGNLSRIPQGQTQHQTIHLIDFKNPENNQFVVTNQLYVKSQKPRIPDVVIYVNGIPLVMIECKSPLNWKDKNGEAFEQVKQYERDIPRLFQSNQFNLITDGTGLLYGATHSPSKFFGAWKDPWPRKDEDFKSSLDKGLWCLLDKERLLDLIAHFIVFERDPDTGKVIKKICRYQQFRAVNKIVQRVADEDKRKGLVWHTQGSGKSLTMVYAALKLKTHLTFDTPALANPNLMVLTDRKDLDRQISGTFEACGIRNPISINSMKDLHDTVRGESEGLTVLSTIFKFQGSDKAIANSRNWIVMVDECHRTQEKDLGAYLRATMPDAQFFGFTGTPVKKNDRDTYANFSVEGETYLDKYGIDDAVADGATVPIFYTGRKTDWHIDDDKLDILFDTWFTHLPDEKLAELKQKGVSVSHLLKHPERIKLIAYDIWTHFKEYAQPDDLKAQIVAYDREAVILYKRALDQVIAEELMKREGLSEEDARKKASTYSACVYSASQEDGKPSEDPDIEHLREGLRQYHDDRTEKEKVEAFKERGEQPSFLIVCDKLLTGFDAPIEAVMYLDKPLKEHNLLQAIARTNRVDNAKKRNGLIVDYIGVSRKLDEALASYRDDDVKNAMRPLDDLLSQLRAAHAEVMKEVTIKRNGKDVKAEIDAFLDSLEGKLDKWFTFRRKARDFISAYEALSPDPSVLDFRDDLKWINQCLRYGTQVMEKKEALDHFEYSHKIRDMLEEHVHATGLSTTIKLRHITDPDFWQDFETEGKSEEELKTAAIRKSTEMRKVTTERMSKNPLQYQRFSDRLLEILKRLETAQANYTDELQALEELAKDIETEDTAHKDAGMDEHAYRMYKILEAFAAELGDEKPDEVLAEDLNALYANDETAPILWQDREQLKKSLRQQVRQTLFQHGYGNMKAVAERIEEYALKHHAKR